uniref:Uncharacterized protein n=1 Tax=Anguilla anguilla TaxID=7936 RepID=A0A0E9S025_ANGAN
MASKPRRSTQPPILDSVEMET